MPTRSRTSSLPTRSLVGTVGAAGLGAALVAALLVPSGAGADPDGGHHDRGGHHGMPMVEVPAEAFRPHAAPVAPDATMVRTTRAGARQLVLRLDRARRVGSVRYHPASADDAVEQYVVAVRRGGRWDTVTTGRWARDELAKTAAFRVVRTDRVRLTAYPSAGGVAPELYAGSVELRGAPDYAGVVRPRAQRGAGDGSLGRWSDPIGLPIVPTTAILLPHDKVLTMSAYSATDYDYDTELTQVSIVDVGARTAGRREVSNTSHQMFCTGLSVLADGRVLITGGSGPSNTTLYDPATDEFTTGPQMEVPRGYQTSVTLSDGRSFTLGGSWSGGRGDKDAEVLDADATSWRRLPNVRASSILTQDEAGIFRSDNHAWLFADRGGRVFHAGPSRAMHWFETRGEGRTTRAGTRGRAQDQMNGNAVMYTRGRILTVGGAPDYSDSPATRRAQVIDIRRGPGHDAEVSRTGGLPEPRALHNSVVLPTGGVLVTGGQERSLPFSDADSVLEPSLWTPRSGRFRNLAPAAVPRNYHSWSLLLADGRVVAGGGGLCGDCEVNHFDVEVFTPPYLLRSDGSLRSRPRITGSVPRVLEAGQRVTVQTDRAVASWSLVRTGTVTHSINSDQRRVPLRADRRAGGYRLTVPASRGVVVPGTYLLFAVDEHGTPSRARWVRIP